MILLMVISSSCHNLEMKILILGFSTATNASPQQDGCAIHKITNIITMLLDQEKLAWACAASLIQQMMNVKQHQDRQGRCVV